VRERYQNRWFWEAVSKTPLNEPAAEACLEINKTNTAAKRDERQALRHTLSHLQTG
jgi:hypothetical protein